MGCRDGKYISWNCLERAIKGQRGQKKTETTEINEKDENYKLDAMTEDEVRRQLVKLKKEEEPGKDEIPSEV